MRIFLWYVVVIVAMIACTCLDGLAAEPPDKPDFSLWAYGNSDYLGGRIGYVPFVNTEIGLDYAWVDAGSMAPEGDGQTVAVYAIWDAVPVLEIPIGGMLPFLETGGLPESVPASVYLGGKVGIELRQTEEPIASFIVGTRIAPNKAISFGIEYNYAFDSGDFEHVLSDQHQALLVINWRF